MVVWLSWSVRQALFERMYRQGRTPWDTGVTPPEVHAFLDGDPPPPPGRALDLGCGTGTNPLFLAGRGWEVVGVDFSSVAIEAAELKLEASGAPGVSFLRADVTQLAGSGLHGPFDFVLDIGCFHSVPLAGRDAYVREVSRVARPGATLLMFAFGAAVHLPGRPRTREGEIRRRFGGSFDLVRAELGTRPPGAAWFTLRRR